MQEKTENPPRLYDLTTLQREANRLYGYTAKQTLDYTQSLYEKKLCTYPRTDSQYLTDDMLPTAETIVSGLFGTLDFAKGVDLAPDYSRILNSKKVTDGKKAQTFSAGVGRWQHEARPERKTQAAQL